MSKTIIVRRTGQAPLRVNGEVIASSSSSLNNASPLYSGNTGLAERVQVIRIDKSKMVVAIEHVTLWQGEHDTYEAAVLSSPFECIEYLSDRVPGWMLEELIDELGEDTVAECGIGELRISPDRIMASTGNALILHSTLCYGKQMG